MKHLVPKPLQVGDKVIVKLGSKHQQWQRITSYWRRRWMVGTVVWIGQDIKAMEVRIPGRYCNWHEFGFHNTGIQIKVERLEIDCFNFSDVIVIRKQVTK